MTLDDDDVIHDFVMENSNVELQTRVEVLERENAALLEENAALRAAKGSSKPDAEVLFHLRKLSELLEPSRKSNTLNQSQELSEVSRDTSLGEGSVHKQLLIRDPNDTDRFSHITVEPTKLYSIQQKALKKDPQEAPLFLLNGVIDLIFPIDVLAASSGLGLRKDGKSGGNRKPLAGDKVAALREYIHSMCGRNQWPEPLPQEINKRFAYKCTNARRDMKLKKL
ncbi:hypothetical protein BSL78_24856 [Apostichopus japonicus]|uniref:Uncharacterized protein n=1 Tax=Stichopus japonicus TaxID=307972 RepID=A0A2G8JRK1_STIJA|nr:hypothetical protein BSL78_24856 [Apostichopus japonicus]